MEISDPRVRDTKYLKLLTDKIEVCKLYKPQFGQGEAVSLIEFEALYGNDSFYSWFGLNNPLMYAAHKAAGGITSLYRQIGIGCEQLFRQILRDQLMLEAKDVIWSYTIPTADARKTRKLSLDGRIELAQLKDQAMQSSVKTWLLNACQQLGIDTSIAEVLKGAVFEVRQGYKSKDSKRQNADITNASVAYTQGYLPVIMVLSTQIDNDIADRYTSAKWLVLKGYNIGSSALSTYSFCREIVGYDLAGFFTRNSSQIKATVDDVLQALLTPENTEALNTPLEVTGSIDELDIAERFELGDDDSNEDEI